MGGSPHSLDLPQRSRCIKGVEARGETEFFFVDSLPDFYAALNAEAFLY